MIWNALLHTLRRCTIPLCYLSLAALFYAPHLVGLRTFPDGDFTHHFLPFSLFQQEAIRSWQLPLWNPHTYSGHPFLADTQAAVFYPVSNLLLLLTLPWDGTGARLYWLQVEAIVHVAAAGWFTFLLAERLTNQRWASFMAGCCFAFSGYLTGYPPLQLAVLRTAIWLPLLLWALLHAMQQPQRRRWWIGAALIYTTMFFAGHPQTFLHSSYVMAAWVLWLFFVENMDARQNLARGIGLLGFFCLAITLSAAQLLPSIEFTQLSVRANVDYAYVSGGFPLQDTWQLLLPGVLTQFSPLYIGIIGLGLALVGAAIHRRSAIFFTSLALLFLLISYGQNGFLYPLFYRFAPGWELFRGQERAAFVVALSLSLLAGLGAAALPDLRYRQRRLLAVIIATVISAAVYTFGVFWQLMGETAVNQWLFLAIAIGTILLALVLVVCMVLPGWERRRELMLAGALLLNLFVVNMGTNVSDFGPVRKTILAPEMMALQGAVKPQNGDDAEIRGRVYNEFRLYEDYAMRLDVEDVWGSSPLRLAHYAALFADFPLDRMWRLTGVETVLTWRRELFVPSTLLAEFPQATDTTYLHALTTSQDKTNPRAWFVSQLRVADDDTMVAALADHTIDLAQIAFIPPEITTEERIMPPGAHTVQLTRLSSQALQIRAKSEHESLLIISENWMPGWQVDAVTCLSTVPACVRTTSDNELPLLTPLRTNLTLIGVVIPAGEITFVLRYRPLSVTIGLAVSGFTAAILMFAVIWRWRRRVSA